MIPVEEGIFSEDEMRKGVRAIKQGKCELYRCMV